MILPDCSRLIATRMGHLHDDIISYYDQNPSGFSFLVQIMAFCHINFAGITKFKYEKKNEKDSGRSSKMTPSSKWPVVAQASVSREKKIGFQ